MAYIRFATDNHSMLIDLRSKGITGKDAENGLVKADITLNKNMVPFDTESPFITSGIRIGTAAINDRYEEEFWSKLGYSCPDNFQEIIDTCNELNLDLGLKRVD